MIYKFCPPTTYSLENLRSGVFFCRHFGDFNDPFEFWSQFEEGVPTEAEKVRLQAAFATWGFPDADPDQIEKEFGWKEFFDSLVDAQPRFRELASSMRITCFSRDPANLLMWSHYADGLRGFCVAIDEKRLGDDASIYLTDVHYTDAPPAVDSFVFAVAKDQYEYHLDAISALERHARHMAGEPNSRELETYQQAADEALEHMRELWRRAYASKPREWGYEREARLLLQSDDETGQPTLWKYPADAVRQIIIGERMTPSYRCALLESLGPRQDVTILQASRSGERYALEIGDCRAARS